MSSPADSTDPAIALSRDEDAALLLDMAQCCFAEARWGFPSAIEEGYEYLARRAALLNEPWLLGELDDPLIRRASEVYAEALAEQPDSPQPEQPRRPEQPPRRRRQRKPTLASVAKQANKAAIAVARYEVRPDGTVVIVTGTPEPSTESNPWLADLNKVTKQ